MNLVLGEDAILRTDFFAVAITTIAEVTRADLRAFLHAMVRWPLAYSVRRLVDATLHISVSELCGGDVRYEPIPADALRRTSWNIRLDEQIYFRHLLRALSPHRLFEIGTFNGATTLMMAKETANWDGRIWTLDLPPGSFVTDQPGISVGQAFHGRPEAERITQLLGSSTSFDFSPWYGTMDFIFVDAAHDYHHGRRDSATALRLAHPGALVVWHDYGPQWVGLTLAIRETTRGLPLYLLEGTTLAAVRIPM